MEVVVVELVVVVVVEVVVVEVVLNSIKIQTIGLIKPFFLIETRYCRSRLDFF